ncbi:DNA replication/repair protein RecF [Gemmatimonadota bacterium]
MHLSVLELRHFRNLGIQELDLPPDGVAIVGGNAQGKSNFLEAIYYLETFRSFRGSRDDQVVAFGEELFRVAGTLHDPVDADSAIGVAAAFQTRGKKKKVTVNGSEPEKIGDGLGRLAAVIFSPSDVGLVSGGPGGRRRFLDILLSLNVPGYLRLLQQYRQVLSQRNASLKEEHSRGLVEAWDDSLVDSGARVMEARLGWVTRWEERYASYYRRVADRFGAHLEYAPSVKLEGAVEVEEIAAAFRDALASLQEREQRLRSTLVGPHRDDLVISLKNEDSVLDLREYGSGGQQRTAALALRLVEADTIREARDQEPIVLMDDVFAELDPARSERILELLEEEERGQVILTAPKESDVRIRRNTLSRWRIEDGVITA